MSSVRRSMRYDDDDFDDLAHPRGSEHSTSAGLIGFIFAMVSVGLLVVVAVLFAFLEQEDQLQQNPDRKRWMLYWFLFLDVLSFFAAIAATFLGIRGVAPSNMLYRGWAMTAMIFGIMEIMVTVGFGFFMTCAVLLFEAFARR